MEWYVADSYKDMEQIGEAFDGANGKKYIKVRGVCPRCGGSGHYSYNQMDGTRCYGCMGSGVAVQKVRAYTEKEYNQYVKAKERKATAEEARKQGLLDNSEVNKNIKLAELGYEIPNPRVYLVGGGNTYEIKDTLKQLGCKYNSSLGWFSTKPIEVPEGFDTVSLSVDEVYEWFPLSQSFSMKEGAKEIANAALKTLLPESKSEYLGNIKDRLRGLRVVVTSARPLEGYYGTSTLYTFLNGENVLVWISSSCKVQLQEGDEVLITGTVKDHKEYNGVKQTVLTRCSAEMVE